MLGGHKGVWVALVFVVEIGSLSTFLNWCVGGAGRGRMGMVVEKGKEGKAVLLYAEAACPGFLER